MHSRWTISKWLATASGAALIVAGAPMLVQAQNIPGPVPPAPIPAPMQVVGPLSGAPMPMLGWTEVFHDQFNGPPNSPINPSSWEYDTGPGSSFGTGEIETMTDSTQNVHQGNGELVIRALESNGAWTSGRIQTTNLYGAPTGGQMLVTALIKQPNPANGLGYWPAFWMLGPGQWPENGEIDILEDVNALSEASHTFHCDVDPGGACNEPDGISSGLLPVPGAQQQFQRYSVLINRTNESDQTIQWFVNNQQVFEVEESQVPTAVWEQAVDHGFSIIFDLAMGGAYPDGVSGVTTPTAATTSGSAMRVKDLAVYEQTPVPTPGALVPPVPPLPTP